MDKKRDSKPKREERGQVIVLGVLCVLFVSLMMILTLNVGQAIFQKIRLQQAADSSAFSLATQEARAFNYFAYTNRANIGSLVAASSLHAFMSMSTAAAELFNSGMINFFIMAGIEFGLCAPCCLPPPGCCCFTCYHCDEGMIDLASAFNYMKERNQLRSVVRQLDEQFIQMISLLDLHMRTIFLSQEAVKAGILAQISSDQITTKLMSELFNLSGINIPDAVRTALNLPQFTKAFESSNSVKQFEASEISNGTRWATGLNYFISARGLGEFLAFLSLQTITDFISGCPESGVSWFSPFSGQARVINGPYSPESRITSNNAGPNDADTVASFDKGTTGSAAFCAGAVSGYGATVSSSTNGGEHTPPQDCVGASQHVFSCLSSGCFTLFKANPHQNEDFGQPNVFVLLSQDLRGAAANERVEAWELSQKGKVGIDLGKSAVAQTGKQIVTVQVSDNPTEPSLGEGFTISKALVYYHWPDYRGRGWKENPNFFNPFWKAKLQAFRHAEVLTLLGVGGGGAFLVAASPDVPLP
jgi:hypothetical protein